MHKHSNMREEMRRYNSTWRCGCFHNLSALDAWWLCVRPLPTSWDCILCTGEKRRALPGPTDQPALGGNRTYQKRTSTRHCHYWFFSRRPQMSLCDHNKLSDWPKTFLGAMDVD